MPQRKALRKKQLLHDHNSRKFKNDTAELQILDKSFMKRYNLDKAEEEIVKVKEEIAKETSHSRLNVLNSKLKRLELMKSNQDIVLEQNAKREKRLEQMRKVRQIHYKEDSLRNVLANNSNERTDQEEEEMQQKLMDLMDEEEPGKLIILNSKKCVIVRKQYRKCA